MNSQVIRPGSDRELRVHDGIIGLVVLLSIVVGMKVDPMGFWLAGLIGLVMISSAFTGFCPLHYVLGKIIPSAK